MIIDPFDERHALANDGTPLQPVYFLPKGTELPTVDNLKETLKGATIIGYHNPRESLMNDVVDTVKRLKGE